jgi:hypothetical protein
VITNFESAVLAQCQGRSVAVPGHSNVRLGEGFGLNRRHPPFSCCCAGGPPNNTPKTIVITGCRVTSASDSGVILTLMIRGANQQTAANLKSDLLEAAKRRFDAEGI